MLGPSTIARYPDLVGKACLAVVGLIAFGTTTAALAEYEGVTPGADNPPPRAEEIPTDTLMLTWPGFMMREEGGSRFFIQTSKPVEVATRKSGSRFEVILRNTVVYLKNNYLPLETQYFDTPVTRATVQRKGRKDTAMVFEMRDKVTPTIRQEKGKGGFNYVFVDFDPRP